MDQTLTVHLEAKIASLETQLKEKDLYIQFLESRRCNPLTPPPSVTEEAVQVTETPICRDCKARIVPMKKRAPSGSGEPKAKRKANRTKGEILLDALGKPLLEFAKKYRMHCQAFF